MKIKKSYNLTTLILIISVGILLLVSTIFVITSYRSTRVTLEDELARSFDFHNRIAEHALMDILENASRSISNLTEQFSLGQQDLDWNSRELKNQLEAYLLGADGSYVDLLAFIKTDGTLAFDLSSPLSTHSGAMFENYLIENTTQNEWQLVVPDLADTSTVALLSIQPVINSAYGRVTGHIIFGISLNQNMLVVNELKRISAVEGIKIIFQDQVLASTNITPLIDGKSTYISQTKNIRFDKFGKPLAIRSYLKNSVALKINSDFYFNFSIFLFVTSIASIFAFILTRRITTTGISQLVRYARAVGDKEQVTHLNPGSITEFNTLGKSLEDMATSVLTSAQALRESKEHTDMLLDSTAEAIYGLDLNGNCTFANPACIQMLGYQNNGELLGQNMHSLIHHSHNDGTPYPVEDCHIYRAIKTRKNIHIDSEVLWRSDGSSFQAEYWSHPIYLDGKPNGAVVTFLDISERRQTETALRRAQKMDAVGQMAGGIAHDFNNILGIILGNLDLLKQQLKGDDDAIERIDKIRKSADRATVLVKQMLIFSRQHPDEVKTININDTITEMDSLINRSITPEVEVVREFADNLWLTSVDPGDFHDALLNLILNARDAMAGPGRLIIETKNNFLDSTYCAKNPDVTPGEHVQLTITDTGSGIPKEEQEKVFEPFFTTKEVGKGTGLGMSMVFGFVKRASGHIKLYSEVGMGTTFKLFFPRYTKHKTGPSDGAEIRDISPRGDETILVVDDEIDLLDIAKRSLQELGYTVLTANDGKKALELMRNDPSISLLFSDVVMPKGMNGVELMEQALVTKPLIKILLTSGFTGRAMAHKSPSPYTANLLSKPYTKYELAQRIRAALDTETHGQLTG